MPDTTACMPAAARLPRGTVLRRNGFTVDAGDGVAVGPPVVTTGMKVGFNAVGGDRKYSMAMPGGPVFGEAGGGRAAGVQIRVDCDAAAMGTDCLMFVSGAARPGKRGGAVADLKDR